MTSKKEVKNMVNSLKYGHDNVISQDDRYTVTKPKNRQDMNYKLYDEEKKKVYLIDVDDVYSDRNCRLKYGDGYGVLYEDFINLNIEELKEYSWKSKNI